MEIKQCEEKESFILELSSIKLYPTRKAITRSMIVFLLFFIFAPCLLSAQGQVYQLDLQKSIDIALEKSYTVKMLRADFQEATYNLRSATSRFKTHLDLELVAPDYTETISQWEDSSGINYFPVKKLNYSSRLNLWQPLPTDGRIYISSGVYNTDDYNKDEKLFMVNTRLGFDQPISALFSYNEINTAFKRAKLSYELSNKELKRTELDLIYQISELFFNLASAKERLNISLQSLNRQTEVLEIAQNKLLAGLIPEVEAMQIEVDLGEWKVKGWYFCILRFYWCG